MNFFLFSLFLIQATFAQSEKPLCVQDKHHEIEKLSDVVCESCEHVSSEQTKQHLKDITEVKKTVPAKISGAFEDLKKESLAKIKSFEERQSRSNDPKKIKELEARIEQERRLVANISARTDEIADEIVKKDCKGFLKKAVISKGAVKLPGSYSPVLGDFSTEEEAEALRSELLEKNPHFTSCQVNQISKEENASVQNTVSSLKSLGKVSGASESFLDNGKGLGTTSTKSLNSDIKSWQELLHPKTDTDKLGRKVSRKMKKIRIYTCASTYRNCAPSREKMATDDSCGALELLREHSDAQVLSALKSNSSLVANLSEEDKRSLRSVLESPQYRQAKKAVYPEVTDEMKDPEKKLWIALSSLRGQTMMEKIKADLGPDVSDDMFEIIPTGHPNDPFNNAKIDPALSGTCGPLPLEGTDSYYGGCLGQKCSPERSLCTKLEKYYSDPEVKGMRERLLKEHLNPNASLDEQYKFHRYYQIEPEMEETLTETINSKSFPNRYQVTCSQLKFRCESIDMTPDIHWGGKGETDRHKSGDKTSCPIF